MSVSLVHYTVQEDRIAEVEAGIRKMFSALEQEQPDGVHFALCKLPDGVTFVGVVELDGTDNPLFGVASANEYRDSLPNWVVGQPPAPHPLEVMGSYRLFESSARA